MASLTTNLNHVLPPHGGVLQVHLLGLVDFDASIGLQEQMVYELSGREDLAGALLIAEHPPTVSMGREASRSQLLVDDEELKRREIPTRWVTRGGGAYVHAPGQLAVYPLLPLKRLGLGLATFREGLESAVLATCREIRIPAKRREESGIWSRGGQLAYLAAAVKNWISCHGIYLNVAIEPRLLNLTLANPAGERSTTMQSQRLDPVRMPQVRESLIRQIADHFGYQSADVLTGHPLLKRTVQRVLTHV